MIKKINLNNGFAQIDNYWSPKIASELNGQHVKLAKFKGDFVWHHHDEEDELFLVVKGRIFIEFRDQTLEINEGEFVTIPRTVEHRPYALEEAQVLLFEPASTINTGETDSDLKKEDLGWIK